MIVQDPLSKYPRLGRYALFFSIIPGYFHEYAAEEVIEKSLNRQSVHGFLKLLQDKNVAIAFPSYYKGKYAIKPEVILDYAQVYTPSFIKEAKRTLGSAFKRGDQVQNFYIDFLLQLSSFKLSGKADLNGVLDSCKENAFHPSSWFTDAVKGLILVMACRKEWRPLFKVLSEENKVLAWNLFMDAAADRSEDYSLEGSEELFLSLGDTIREDVITWFASEYDLYRTGFSGFTFDQLSDDYWTKDLLKGIFQASHGNFKEGQKGVLSALKEDVKYHRGHFVYYKNPLFFRPIRNVFLTAVLFLDRGSASTARKISSLLKKTEEFSKDIASDMVALVFTFVDNPEKITPFDHEAMASRLKENDSSLAIFVLAVLCKIFSYGNYRSILESHLAKRKKENNPPLKYILQQALDALNPNDPEVAKLTAELKCPPLLSHYATLSEWQFGLDKLLNYSKILKKPTSKNTRARIVYLVDIDTFDIQPYRQKSKDGITWSKGTAVSMSSFAEMLPEMDEADQIAAAKVVRVNSRVARLRGLEVLVRSA